MPRSPARKAQRPRLGNNKEKQGNYMALKSTMEIVKAACDADPTINAAQRKGALAELEGKGVREMMGEPPPRAYPRKQVAALFGVNPKTVTAYARRGLLVPIYSGASGLRAQAYTGESVAALLSGKVSAK